MQRMNASAALRGLQAELRGELTRGILPFWTERAMDERHGGVVGFVAADGARRLDAPKGSILHARVLWTLSAAHRLLGDRDALAHAGRLAEHFRRRFIDPVHGGVHWMIDADGTPRDPRKHVYAQAFAIYALTEHYRAADDLESLRRAIELFETIERHAHDDAHGGYREAFSRDWALLDDARLSEADAREPKSMNTHLHLLEGYAALFRAWPDALLRRRLEELVGLFLGTIVRPGAGHVTAFFEEDWTPKSSVVSYGHDIEASWLLREAADVLGDEPLRERVRAVAGRLAVDVLDRGVDDIGGLFVEGGPEGPTDTDKEWWPQAEGIVGFVATYQETGREPFLEAALSTWEFTKRHVVDATHGEWRRRVARDGTPRPGHEIVGPWKCPYHNGRACLEVIARVDDMAAAGGR